MGAMHLQHVFWHLLFLPEPRQINFVGEGDDPHIPPYTFGTVNVN